MEREPDKVLWHHEFLTRRQWLGQEKVFVKIHREEGHYLNDTCKMILRSRRLVFGTNEGLTPQWLRG